MFKSFAIVPEGRDRNIAASVDQVLNGWLKANPKANVVNLKISAQVNPNLSGTALVVLQYEEPQAETKKGAK